MYPDDRFLELVNIELPIVQAPMAGADSAELAAAVSAAGGLGSLGCALRSAADIASAVAHIRRVTNRPFNLNFFCHVDPAPDPAVARRWLERLRPYYDELGIAPPTGLAGGRQPFNAELADLVAELRPPVVSFHFGLPAPELVKRVRAAGCVILCSATRPEEAAALDGQGVDAIIAQGWEAGGHRGTFLGPVDGGQMGTLALVPQVVDAVRVPVVAAGGIADGRTAAACMVLGASAVQVGTAFLLCPESGISAMHRNALARGRGSDTAVTNVMTGRPARGLMNRLMREQGPMSPEAPEFPLASPASSPLRSAAESRGSTDFTSLWAGQSLGLSKAMPAAELTRAIAVEARTRLQAVAEVGHRD